MSHAAIAGQLAAAIDRAAALAIAGNPDKTLTALADIKSILASQPRERAEAKRIQDIVATHLAGELERGCEEAGAAGKITAGTSLCESAPKFLDDVTEPSALKDKSALLYYFAARRENAGNRSEASHYFELAAQAELAGPTADQTAAADEYVASATTLATSSPSAFEAQAARILKLFPASSDAGVCVRSELDNFRSRADSTKGNYTGAIRLAQDALVSTEGRKGALIAKTHEEARGLYLAFASSMISSHGPRTASDTAPLNLSEMVAVYAVTPTPHNLDATLQMAKESAARGDYLRLRTLSGQLRDNLTTSYPDKTLRKRASDIIFFALGWSIDQTCILHKDDLSDPTCDFAADLMRGVDAPSLAPTVGFVLVLDATRFAQRNDLAKASSLFTSAGDYHRKGSSPSFDLVAAADYSQSAMVFAIAGKADQFNEAAVRAQAEFPLNSKPGRLIKARLTIGRMKLAFYNGEEATMPLARSAMADTATETEPEFRQAYEESSGLLIKEAFGHYLNDLNKMSGICREASKVAVADIPPDDAALFAQCAIILATAADGPSAQSDGAAWRARANQIQAKITDAHDLEIVAAFRQQFGLGGQARSTGSHGPRTAATILAALSQAYLKGDYKAIRNAVRGCDGLGGDEKEYMKVACAMALAEADEMDPKADSIPSARAALKLASEAPPEIREYMRLNAEAILISGLLSRKGNEREAYDLAANLYNGWVRSGGRENGGVDQTVGSAMVASNPHLGIPGLRIGGMSTPFLLAASALRSSQKGPANDLFDETFSAAQDTIWSSAAAAVRITRLRVAAARGGSMAQYEGALQDDLAATKLLDEAITTGNMAQARSISAQQSTIENRISSLRVQASKENPAFFSLLSADPVSANDLVKLGALRSDEAIIMVVTSDENGWVWVLTQEGRAWAEIPDGTISLKDSAYRLHCQLNHETSCSDQHGDKASSKVGLASLLSHHFDRGKAYSLYQRVLGNPSVASLIAGKRRWTFVVAGPLAILPPQVLVMKAPLGSDSDAAAMQNTVWVGLEHTVELAPSIAALVDLRSRGRAGPPTTFLGVGAPLLKRGSAEGPLSSLPDLPFAEKELVSLRDLFGNASPPVQVGTMASERSFRSGFIAKWLPKADVVAIATHGLEQGEHGVSEPGLVLSLPETPGPDDDGYLSASKIALLRFHNSFVVLSACNSAAGSGRGEMLSGLSRAFFYAGASSMLVSYWQINDAAASDLILNTVRAWKADPAKGRAEALRDSMTKLVKGETALDHYRPTAFPEFWAPFVVLGD